MPSPSLAPSLHFAGGIIIILAEAAEQAVREAMRHRNHARRVRRGATLRPGVNTPLWNELIQHADPFLRKYGSKAQLARLLKLPRQRLQDCLKAKSACLDAERTLLLLCWVSAQQRGQPFLL